MESPIAEAIHDVGVMFLVAFIFYETHSLLAFLLLLLKFSGKSGHYGN